MAEPKIQTPGTLATQIVPFTTNANELMAQAERAVIDTPETFNTSVDFIKICTSQLRSAEEIRKSLVKPLNDHVAWINAQFRPITGRIEEAKKLMNRKATEYQTAEEARLAEEAWAERKRQEELALQQAEIAAESGDEETAEAILDVAIATPEKEAKAPTGRGTLTGASGSSRGVWKGQLDDVKAVCAAVAAGELPKEIITVSKSGMNKIANEQKKEGVYKGIEIIFDKSVVVR